MKQQFIKEIRGHFNLRKPKGSKPTDVFFVVCLYGKQYKLSSGMKVYPDQWDSKMQQAIESNQLSKLDNRNNKLLNEKINSIRCSFMDYLKYLCTVEIETIDIEELLKLFIYKDMKKKKNLDFDAEHVISDALEYYYANVCPVKIRTKRNNESKLNHFVAYIKEKGLNGDVTLFSQRGINDYKDYLLYKMNNGGDFGIAHLNGILELISRLINKVLIVNTKYLQYGFSKVEYVNNQMYVTESPVLTNHYTADTPKKDDGTNPNRENSRQRFAKLLAAGEKCGWQMKAEDIKNTLETANIPIL